MKRNLAIGEKDGWGETKGIQRRRRLPDARLGALWDSIILDEALKSQMLSQAVLNFTLRRRVDRTVLPLHGAILLVGLPGTGKTSLARGLAHRCQSASKTDPLSASKFDLAPGEVLGRRMM